MSVPIGPQDLTAEWLSQALGAVVSTVEILHGCTPSELSLVLAAYS